MWSQHQTLLKFRIVEDSFTDGEINWLDEGFDVWPPVNLSQKFWVFAREYLDPVDEEYLQQWWSSIVQLFNNDGISKSQPQLCSGNCVRISQSLDNYENENSVEFIVALKGIEFSMVKMSRKNGNDFTGLLLYCFDIGILFSLLERECIWIQKWKSVLVKRSVIGLVFQNYFIEDVISMH